MVIQKVTTPKDIAATAVLAREIWQEHFVRIIGQAQVDYMLEKFQSANAITDQIRQNYAYYRITHNNENCGYTAIIPDPAAGRLMLSKLYVKKQMRGLGLGVQMLDFVEDVCRRQKIQTIWLTVNKDNDASIQWYLRHGFVHTRSEVKDIGNGFVMDDYILEKTVN